MIRPVPATVPREIFFAIMRYKGHPRTTSTIYLPFEIADVPTISKMIAAITGELDLSQKVVWQREDGLETTKI